MDAAAELGRNPVSKRIGFSLSMEISRLTRDGTAEPVSRDQIILRHVRGQGNIHFPCSADNEQDWQPYPVDPYSAVCDDHTYILRTYMPTFDVDSYRGAIHSTTLRSCIVLDRYKTRLHNSRNVLNCRIFNPF